MNFCHLKLCTNKVGSPIELSNAPKAITACNISSHLAGICGNESV